jgi:hypothetical protein
VQAAGLLGVSQQDPDVVPKGTGRVERSRGLEQHTNADAVVGGTR